MKTQEGLFDFDEIKVGFSKREKKFYVPYFNFGGLHYKSQSIVTKKIKAIKERRLSSINFQKAKKYSYSHNFREEDEKKEAKYLLPEEYHQENEYWALSDENGKIKSPQEVFLEEVRKSNRKGGPKPKFENAHWEAVINLNSHHTMEDLHKLREHFESKYKFICCAMTIHRDEGVLLDIEGEKVPKYNYHAHLNFITYANGGQQFRLNKRQLADIQSEVAEVLGMERGKEFSKTKRLAHQHYRYIKQQEEKLKKENEFVLQQNTELQEKNQSLELELTNQRKRKAFWSKKRQEMIQEGGYTQEDYQFIRAIIMDSHNDYDSAIKAINAYKEAQTTKKRQGEVIVELKKELAIKEQELALEKQNSIKVIPNLKEELKTLKIENESLKSERPSFEQIKESLTYEQRKEIAEPLVKVYRETSESLEAERDRFFNENQELKIERRTYYETQGWNNVDFNQALAKEKAKSERLEGIIQKFHNLLVRLGLKKEDSHSYEVPTLTESKNENRMYFQARTEMEKRVQKQGRGR